MCGDLRNIPGEGAEDRTRGDGAVTSARVDEPDDRRTDALQVGDATVDVCDLRLGLRSDPRARRRGVCPQREQVGYLAQGEPECSGATDKINARHRLGGVPPEARERLPWAFEQAASLVETHGLHADACAPRDLPDGEHRLHCVEAWRPYQGTESSRVVEEDPSR